MKATLQYCESTMEQFEMVCILRCRCYHDKQLTLSLSLILLYFSLWRLSRCLVTKWDQSSRLFRNSKLSCWILSYCRCAMSRKRTKREAGIMKRVFSLNVFWCSFLISSWHPFVSLPPCDVECENFSLSLSLSPSSCDSLSLFPLPLSPLLSPHLLSLPPPPSSLVVFRSSSPLFSFFFAFNIARAIVWVGERRRRAGQRGDGSGGEESGGGGGGEEEGEGVSQQEQAWLPTLLCSRARVPRLGQPTQSIPPFWRLSVSSSAPPNSQWLPVDLFVLGPLPPSLSWSGPACRVGVHLEILLLLPLSECVEESGQVVVAASCEPIKWQSPPHWGVHHLSTLSPHLGSTLFFLFFFLLLLSLSGSSWCWRWCSVWPLPLLLSLSLSLPSLVLLLFPVPKAIPVSHPRGIFPNWDILDPLAGVVEIWNESVSLL